MMIKKCVEKLIRINGCLVMQNKLMKKKVKNDL